MGVVQHQGLSPGIDGGLGALHTVAGDPGGGVDGQHQRLVADFGGGVDAKVHLNRPHQRAAVAARQGGGIDALGVQQAQDLAGDRGLARAADRQVADGDDRGAGIDGRGPGDAPGGDAAPYP
ncbi:hypothetical protein D3C80_1148670 [compost metagenome]